MNIWDLNLGLTVFQHLARGRGGKGEGLLRQNRGDAAYGLLAALWDILSLGC